MDGCSDGVGVRVGDAKTIAREWVFAEASKLPGFCGAYFIGSINSCADDAAGARALRTGRPLAISDWPTTHMLLVAGLRNPTVRKRYVAVRELLIEYGQFELYEELLELLGCARMDRARVRKSPLRSWRWGVILRAPGGRRGCGRCFVAAPAERFER